MKHIIILCLFSFSAFAGGLKLHPKDPFECTFHFITLSPEEHLIFDIIRSDVNGNSIRFVHLLDGKVDSIFIRSNTNGAFKFEKNRISGTSDDLNFDISFDTEKKGSRIPPVAGFGYDISLLDYPLVKYSGVARFGNKEWSIKENSVGSISHHFGNKLPNYYYFNALRNDESSLHVVGAFAVIPHKVLPAIKSGYVVITGKKSKTYNLLNAKVAFQRNEDGSHSLKVDPFFGKSFEIHVPVGPSDQMYEHTLEGLPTTLQFDSKLTMGEQTLPAVIDIRGELNSGL